MWTVAEAEVPSMRLCVACVAMQAVPTTFSCSYCSPRITGITALWHGTPAAADTSWSSVTTQCANWQQLTVPCACVAQQGSQHAHPCLEQLPELPIQKLCHVLCLSGLRGPAGTLCTNSALQSLYLWQGAGPVSSRPWHSKAAPT